MQGTDKWQEQFSTRLKNLESTVKDTRGDVTRLENWRIDHMSICHPKILGRLAIIFGVATGIALVVGYVMGNLYPVLAK